MSYLLGIDSTSIDSINLSIGAIENTNYFDLEIENKSSAEAIIPGIVQLLKKSNLTLEKVEKILIASGPGSFTGIRNAMSSALGLGFGLKKDIFAASILQIDAYLGVNKKKVLLLKKANNNEYYSQYFEFENKKIIKKEPLIIVSETNKSIHFQEILATKGLDPEEIQVLEIVQKCKINTAQGLITFYQANPEYFIQVFDKCSFKVDVEAEYVKPVNAKTLEERGMERGLLS